MAKKKVIIQNTVEYVDGRKSVTYLIREGNTVKSSEILLDAGTDPQTYGDSNADKLFNRGVAPPSLVNPVAVFNATKERQAQGVHLKAIFSAFNALVELDGGVDAMILAAKTAYQDDEDKLAIVQDFITKYKNATDAHRHELNALAIYAISALITSRK